MSQKVVIVGGVAGGASTAARLRRLDEEAEIVLFERGEHVSYANCGLPYYIGEIIQDREELFVMSPQQFKEWFNIEVRTNSEVTSLDCEAKAVEVKDQVSGEKYRESYDKLVLSPGAEAVRPPFPGAELSSVFTLRSVPDTDRIYDFIRENNPGSAVVVGAGFIGLEMAENLFHRGIKVSVVEMLPQVLPFLDEEMAAFMQQYMRRQGVSLHLRDGVAGFEKSHDKGVKVKLNSGEELETDMVLLSVGVKPEINLAWEAGLEVERGIKVNRYLQTSDPHIYALGDAVEKEDFVTGNKALIPLAGPANKQGRTVANNIAGRMEAYQGTQGTSVLKVFDMVAAGTGANERTLQEAGLDYHSCIVHPGSHAGYYPGSSQIALKLLFSPEGKIYGAQAIGESGVDKRIDVLAAALRMKEDVYSLQQLELAYAPPFSSAKDPANIAGYAAGNILQQDLQVIGAAELLEIEEEGLEKSGIEIVDVRNPEELEEEGQVPGARNIPLAQIRDRFQELPRDKELVLYCAVGKRSYLASRILMQKGFPKIRSLNGGYRTYQALKQERKNLS